jgi:hypothetical protein
MTHTIKSLRELCEKSAPNVRAAIYEPDDGIYLVWKNPYDGSEERIASFWWPGHPAEATAQVEQYFENSAKLAAASRDLIPLLLDEITKLRDALQLIDYLKEGFEEDYIPRASDISFKTLKESLEWLP